MHRKQFDQEEDFLTDEYETDPDDYDYGYDEYEDDYPEGMTTSKRIIGVVICLALLAALLGTGMWLYNRNLNPVNPNDPTPQYVTVEQGMLPGDVAELLKDSDLVRNAMVFRSYVGRHSYGGAEIQAATYELSKNMSVPEIYTKLINGDAYVGQLINVTIPEGMNLNEVGQIVAGAGICSAEEFIAEASDINKYKASYPILDSIPEEEIPQRTLEGYLFPDTYSVVGTGPQGASSLIQNQLTRFTEQYTPELIQKTQEAGRTVDDVVILASIVELETKLPEDKPVAASVFYNRMAQNIPLQSDITIDYINGTRTPVLTTEQTQVESPYNTYLNLGLPLGPICNPGILAIQACVEPAQTDYLYFVADMNTGQLHFNSTLEGHNQDVATYMQ